MGTLEKRVEELITRLQEFEVKVKGWDIHELDAEHRMADIYIDDWVINTGMLSEDCVVFAIN